MVKHPKLLAYSMLLFILTACSDPGYIVIEEDKSAPLQFKNLEVYHDYRAGPELGILIKAEVDGFDRISGTFHVRVTSLDSAGRALQSTIRAPGLVAMPIIDPLTSDTTGWDTVEILASIPLVRFDSPDSVLPPLVRFFLPYHWLAMDTGPQVLQLDLDAMPGAFYPQMTGLVGMGNLIAESQKTSPIGHIRIDLEIVLPELHAVRISVPYIEMNIDEFNPHDMDFSIRPKNPTHGFPDIYWAVGIGYERVYKSSFWRNTVTARWDEPTPVIYVRGPQEKISLCVIDWDDERILKNKHDEIACWEGVLSELSSNLREPSRLKFPRVRRMEVSVEWLGKD